MHSHVLQKCAGLQVLYLQGSSYLTPAVSTEKKFASYRDTDVIPTNSAEELPQIHCVIKLPTVLHRASESAHNSPTDLSSRKETAEQLQVQGVQPGSYKQTFVKRGPVGLRDLRHV